MARHDCAGDTPNNFLGLLESVFRDAPALRRLSRDGDVFPGDLRWGLGHIPGYSPVDIFDLGTLTSSSDQFVVCAHFCRGDFFVASKYYKN